MKAVLRIWMLVCLAFIATAPAVAPAIAQASGAKDPERIAAVRELMRVMGSERQFDDVVGLMSMQLALVAKQQRPQSAKEIDEVFALMTKRFVERKNELIDQVAPLYAERFTTDELNAIIAFYKTPVGAKLVAALPDLTRKSMMLGAMWGEKLGAEVDREAREELKRRGVEL